MENLGDAKVEVGDVIQVNKSFLTSDESLQISIATSAKGVVVRLDDDGDALIAFLDLPGVAKSSRWVVRSNFRRLSVLR